MKTMMKSVVLVMALGVVGTAASAFAAGNTVSPPVVSSTSYHLSMDLADHSGSVAVFNFTPGQYVNDFNGGDTGVELDPNTMQSGLNVSGTSKLPATSMQFGFTVTNPDTNNEYCKGTVDVNSVNDPSAAPNAVSVTFTSGGDTCSVDASHPGYLWFEVA